MPKLSATRTYADNQSPVQSDLDAFIDDIEILVNTIQLDDDNFQTGGIDGDTKLIDSTITANQIRNNNITSAKLASNSVTTEAIQDGAVTAAKIADTQVDEDVTSVLAGYLTPGFVEMFHSFNSTVSIPRGWMLCNGDTVDQTNYDAIHGAGAYTTDGVAGSPLLNKNLPAMSDRYAVGVSDTTKDGSSAITAVGNTNHEIDLSHTHDTSHNHVVGTGVSEQLDGTGTFASPTNGGDILTDNYEETSSSTLSSTTDIQPESIEFLYIIKVV